MSARLAGRDIRVVLLDIEGTTTPIAFVHETLFPYARARLGAWLRAHTGLPDYVRLIDGLEAEYRQDERAGQSLPRWARATPDDERASALAYLEWLMDRDRKSPPLKTLQGWIWEIGYQSGELHGQVYPDVPAALRRWVDEGCRVAIYSSGSELTQRRLFASVPEGDLTPLITSYFDTAVGAKREPSSYQRIASALGHEPGTMLFISDVTAELDAATAAGFQVVLSVRPGNPSQPDAARFTVVTSFDALP